jgi:hypothetical protein
MDNVETKRGTQAFSKQAVTVQADQKTYRRKYPLR